MTHKHGRRDENHLEVCRQFQQLGFSTLTLADMGDNCPDLLISRAGRTALIEIKSDGGKLTPGQARFAKDWRGRCYLVRGIDDILAITQAWFQDQPGDAR